MSRLLALLPALLIAPAAAAEEPADPRISPETLAVFEAHVFKDGDFELPYRLASPDDVAPDEKRPLLLFLHGYGERGTENQRQLIHGGGLFASPEFREWRRAFVVAPQCPDGVEPGTDQQQVWTGLLNRKGDQMIDLDAPAAAPLAAAKRLVEHLVATRPVDPDRLYVSGLSMGGYATWELATRYPDFWAAAAPICGAADTSHAGRLTKLPIWNFHGDADGSIPVERSREIVRAVNDAGGRIVYTEYPGVGHDSWTPTFESRHVWDWLFTQQR